MDHQENNFQYNDERFADLQMLRYRLRGFEQLTVKQKLYIYCLSKATLMGRDITFDQQGKFNLRIRKTLEAIYKYKVGEGRELNEEFKKLEVYLKRVWFSSGIYHHYGCEKFQPEFSEQYFCDVVSEMPEELLPLKKGENKEDLLNELLPVLFDPTVLPKRVNQADGADLVETSACNFYEGVSQPEVERFYEKMKSPDDTTPPSYGLNSKVTKRNGEIVELAWTEDGLYGKTIHEICSWLRKAQRYAENEEQSHVIDLLLKYYHTGNLRDFDLYSIAWVGQHEGIVDFINGFIEVYGDPLGLKGTWEGIVEYKDLEATRRTQTISNNAQWFEDHSPVDPKYRKPVVKGVSANVICAAMLGGDEYPASAIGINLPNADWIREQYGSKSVTIGNLTEAYDKAAKGNGFREEFIEDADMIALIDKYGNLTDDLHTDLHECLGHGSGQMLPGVKLDDLKAYGSTIEEARADLFGLYYMADPKLVELGLLPDQDAYKAQYYSYLLNGLLTQTARVKLGENIEEAHMRNRALIAWWTLQHAPQALELYKHDGKTYLRVNDFQTLRSSFAALLSEIQRIKSEGDLASARDLVEQYAVKINPDLHKEILDRYNQLDIAPYKGFINPWMKIEYDETGNPADVILDYTETYTHQMLRYSDEYGTL